MGILWAHMGAIGCIGYWLYSKSVRYLNQWDLCELETFRPLLASLRAFGFLNLIDLIA